MAGIITSIPPLVEQPPGSNSSNPAGLPGVTYTVANLNLPQTWTAKQTFPLGDISINAADIIGLPVATVNPIDIFLVIGDSNAVGQGVSGSSPTVPPGQVLMYTATGTIVDANDPTKSAINSARDANTGSMWPALGIAYGRKVGFVLAGQSGSTQSSAADLGSGNWDTAGALYAQSLTALNAALTAYTAAGYSATFRGIIYVLGNNDAFQIDAAVITVSQYTTALTTMLSNYRAATIGGRTYPHLSVFMPVIGTNLSVSDTGYAQVRGAQLAYAATDGNTLVPFVDTLSFSTRGLQQASSAHPTQAGYNIMGTAIGARITPYVPANNPYQLINANTGIGVAPPAGTVLHVVGANAISTINLLDVYGSSGSSVLRAAAGTAVAPTAILNGAVLGVFGVRGYGATGFSAANNGAILWSATEDHTDAAHGTSAGIYVTANGATTPSRAVLANQDRTIQLPAYSTGLVQSDSSGNLTATNTISGSIAINSGTLPSGGAAAFALTATQPTVPVGVQIAYQITVTGAGSASQINEAVNITYAAGYTGSSSTFAYVANNLNVGTANVIVPAANSNGAQGNTGASGGANTAATTGGNMGVRGAASGGAVNVGVHGIAQISTNSATNIGVLGTAINGGTSPVSIGGFFSLNQTTTPTVSSALIADNGSQALPVALFRVAGATKFQVDQFGCPVFPTFTVATLPASVEGAMAYITDATLTAITGLGVAPTGGGTNRVMVYKDNVGWKII